MMRHSIETKTRKFVKGYGFLLLARNLLNKYGKQLSDTVTKTRIEALKAASKKVVCKTAEVTRESIGKQIVDKSWNLQEMLKKWLFHL